MFKNLFGNKKTLNYLIYAFSFFVTVFLALLLINLTDASDFFSSMENRTFDLRQNFLVKSKVGKTNKDIVIVAIDDASYEYLLDKYGEWPIPRDVYAKFIDYVEGQKPTSIVFDLMFVKSMKSQHGADLALVNAMKRYSNVYTAMNFDNQSFDVRKPVALPQKLTVNVKNDSKVDFTKDLTFQNCRAILPQILDSNPNVGMINVRKVL